MNITEGQIKELYFGKFSKAVSPPSHGWLYIDQSIEIEDFEIKVQHSTHTDNNDPSTENKNDLVVLPIKQVDLSKRSQKWRDDDEFSHAYVVKG
jgi:hypothetical protein